MISGKINHGKDYLADLLVQELIYRGHSAEKISTARVMKDMTCRFFNISQESLDVLKNTQEPVLLPGNHGIFNFRTFLQRFGSIAKEIGGKQVWADTLLKDIQSSDSQFIIVPDLRYPYEYSTVNNSIKALSVCIYNDDIPVDNSHHSETSMDNFCFDIRVNNTGRPCLVPSVDRILNKVIDNG